ncbi:MAG: UDP-N-acetylmuramoyl-L-alanyl-D-glutamate--2,6-diaminopimelate ligase [Myxococcales bacterium FL481]|nr:MAG: UDP-N-acetylmuramoyl-L-alanyl-D-glutamate--2,6-diaminopimelate ligase [Myxococcales bacterium FL481]
MTAPPATTVGELVTDMPVQLLGCDPSLTARGLETDSRLVQPGQAFVAVAGARVDGHHFVDAARDAGAAVVVVSRDRRPPDGSWEGPTVVLDNTARRLPQLAARAYGQAAAKLDLVGITGTNGKTTTAHLVAGALAACGRPHVRLGTTGHWVGDREVPASFTTPFPAALHRLFYEAHRRGATCGVMEVSSHALAQGRIEGLEFRGVGMTSFSQDHLDYHHDLQDYLRAKCSLASAHLVAGGAVTVPVELGSVAQAFVSAGERGGGRPCLVSAQGDMRAEWRIVGVHPHGPRTRLQLQTPLGSLVIDTGLIGRFNLDNLLIAAALLQVLGLSGDQIVEGLRVAHGAPGRLEPVLGPSAGPRVFVDYAHTPDAVARVIEAVRPHTPGRVVVVLGCGGDRDRTKRPLMARAALAGGDVLIATSDNPRTEDPEHIVDDMLRGLDDSRAERVIERRDAIARAIGQSGPEDTVLVLGKGHETVQIVGTRRLPFDDRRVAADALATG